MIHAIGAAAERRVWTRWRGNRQMYPNIFVLLVSPPGIGKSTALSPAAALLRKSGAVALAPNDMTKQGMLDSLASAVKGAAFNGSPFDYHFLAISISELANFMPKYDIELAGLLTQLYDCEDINEEKKRSHDKGAVINFPGVSFIIGTATQNLGHTIPTEMWGSGFMARVIMVFSAEEVIPEDMFTEAGPTDTRLENEIVVRLNSLGKLVGPMFWTPEARVLNNAMRQDQKAGGPLHNRLAHYNQRRWMHLSKLTMIAALQHERLTVHDADHHTALGWLLEAEAQMPDVFRDMNPHEDGALHEELRNAMHSIHFVTRRPIAHEVLVHWLSTRTASYSIPRIIEIAIAAGYFKRVAGTTGDEAEYIPQAPKGSTNLGVL